MNEPEDPPRRHQWPWFAAGVVVLGLVLAVVWMRLAVKKLEQERDVNGPLPASAPSR